jgi:prevent-host-death family protein
MGQPARQVPQRELRNSIGAVLREVEGGVSLRVTVRGRPVADLVPVRDTRARRFVPRAEVERLLGRYPPDPAFAADIDEAFAQTVDELDE